MVIDGVHVMPYVDRHNVGAARDLRQRQTPAEKRLWELVRGRRFAGLKFRRQHPAGSYVVDFCIERLGLVIELDGPIHQELAEQDAHRDAWMRAAGFTVLRVANDDVLHRPGAVLALISCMAEECAAARADQARRRSSDSDT